MDEKLKKAMEFIMVESNRLEFEKVQEEGHAFARLLTKVTNGAEYNDMVNLWHTYKISELGLRLVELENKVNSLKKQNERN